MIRTLTTGALSAIALLACAPAAQAQTAPVDPWVFAGGFATDNRSKDTSKSDGDAYGWGTATWQPSALFYAGPGFETVKSSTGSELELKAFAGLRPRLGGFAFDLNAAYKYLVDADPGTDHDNWEFTADVKHALGPITAKARYQYSPDGSGSVRAWRWIEARADWKPVPPLTLTAGVGRREQDNSVDYTGWDAGGTWAFNRTVSASLRYYATDATVPGEQYADSVVAGVAFTF